MTLTERLRVELSRIADEECYNVGQHQLMFLRQSEARELRDALDAQAARINELEGALRFVQDDLENCDWSCERCGKDFEMKDTDIYLCVTRAREALKDKP